MCVCVVVGQGHQLWSEAPNLVYLVIIILGVTFDFFSKNYCFFMTLQKWAQLLAVKVDEMLHQTSGMGVQTLS